LELEFPEAKRLSTKRFLTTTTRLHKFLSYLRSKHLREDKSYIRTERTKNSTKKLNKKKMNKLKKLVQEEVRKTLSEAGFPEGEGDKVYAYNKENNQVYQVNRDTAEEEDKFEAPEPHMVPGTSEYKKKQKMPKFCVPSGAASDFAEGMREKGFDVMEDPAAGTDGKIVRQELVKEFKREKKHLAKKLQEKHKIEELRSFREDAMRAYLDKYPIMNAIFERSGKSLKTFWDTHVRNNARNERRYSHSL